MRNIIYRNWNTGLGDCIATLSLLNHLQRQQDRVVYLSTRQHGTDLRPKLQELMGLMPTYPGDKGIELVDEEPNTDLDGFAVWGALPFATRLQWRLEPKRHVVTYHFTGISAAEDKNPPEVEQLKIREWIRSKGYIAAELGPQVSLETCAKLLVNSVMFVGCDSGFAHLAHAVRLVPTYILEYKLPIITCHRNKPHVVCRGADHFISQAENYRTFLKFINQAPENLPS